MLLFVMRIVELEPESSDSAAKVLWSLLLPGQAVGATFWNIYFIDVKTFFTFFFILAAFFNVFYSKKRALKIHQKLREALLRQQKRINKS